MPWRAAAPEAGERRYRETCAYRGKANDANLFQSIFRGGESRGRYPESFDHLLALTLNRIAEVRVEREDLIRQRDLLRRKRTALERGGWTFDAVQGMPPDAGALATELNAITAQLKGVGADAGVSQAHLGIVADSLGETERQLWAEEIALSLDAMNIQRDPGDPSARRIALEELHNARGWRLVMLPLMITPGEIPPREDFVTAAER